MSAPEINVPVTESAFKSQHQNPCAEENTVAYMGKHPLGTKIVLENSV